MRAAGLAVAAAGLALAALHPSPAEAVVITTSTNQALSNVPFAVTLGGGTGTLFFTAATADDGPGAAVATGTQTAQVTTIFGQVADYGPGTVFDGTASFAKFPTPATIEFSAADDYIGFTYTDATGQHLGYAEVFGPNLIGYAYQTTPGASLTAAPIATPEPASMALLAVGAIGACATYSRRRSKPAVDAGGALAG